MGSLKNNSVEDYSLAPQRELAAFRAIAFRLAGESFLALDRPPFFPPMLPKATAWGLRVSGLGSGKGLPSICSPMACSTTERATSMKSRFGLERFAMMTSCHEFIADASPVEIMQTHYLPLWLIAFFY
jgi:hypothetical protein